MKPLSIVTALAVLVIPVSLMAQDDAPSEDRRVAGNEQQRYFLIGAKADQEAPENGHALLLVLPGGDGSAEFNPFVRNIWRSALPDGYLVAQLVAVPSNNPNQIVWPTAKDREPKQKFTTESFIDAVVADVKQMHRIDERRVYVLAWSSGGPAAYAAILREQTPITGAFIAMSVFRHPGAAAMKHARDKRFFLLQSPADEVTRYIFATNAKKQLSAAGAKVQLRDYAGGHGWHGDIFGNIRDGIEWLESQE